MEQLWHAIHKGTPNTWRKFRPYATLCATNPTCIGLEVKTGLRVWTPTTKPLSHARCFNVLLVGYKTEKFIYRVSLSLEAPNYCLCVQSNSAGFSFVNTGKQVHLKHARRHFERNLVKDVHHRIVASRN